MRDTYRVPVRDVFEVGGLLRSEILAGRGGQGRTITTVSIIESPDVLDWVRPHTFVMTGGFPLRHLDPGGAVSADSISRLVSQLDDLDVAGLGIQFGTHLSELPQEVLDLADSLDFPIVSLPTDVPFDQLFSQTMVEVIGVRDDVLKRTYDLHSVLEGLLLEGADVDRIADQISRSLGLGILVTTVDGRQLADSFTSGMHAELRAAHLFDETGRFRNERVRSPVKTTGGGQLLTEPIVAAGSDLARLVAFAPLSVIGEDVRYALQRAASVLALLITQRQALNVVESKYRGDFLRDVLSGRAKNREHSEAYAAGLGWRLDMPCIVISAQIDPQAPGDEPVSTRVKRAWQTRFHTAWTQVVAQESSAYPCADFSDEVVVVLSPAEGWEDDDPAATVAELQKVVGRMVHRVSGDRGGGRRPFSVGTSRLVTSFDGLPNAYHQARRATEVGRRFAGGRTSHFDDLGIHRLIGLIPDNQELAVFAKDILGELADDDAQARELRTTLQVLLDHNLNVAEASRELVMHYNTLRYRITKLEKVLGPFTADATLRLNIAVALQVHKMLQ